MAVPREKLQFAVRLEYRPPLADERLHVDVWATHGTAIVALQPRYKQRRLRVSINGEPFDLAGHGARNFGRFDALDDLCRIERLAATAGREFVGYAVLLTNDDGDPESPHGGVTADTSFRLHEGRTIFGELTWGAAQGARENRDRPLQIVGSYPVKWADYSTPAPGRYGTFRYLLFRVGSPSDLGGERPQPA